MYTSKLLKKSLLLMFIVLCVFCLAASVSALSDNPAGEPVILTREASGESDNYGENGLNSPVQSTSLAGIASASGSETYVFVTKWGTNGSVNGEFYYPYGVAVDSSGNVYVADTNNNRIQKFDSTGNFITKWGTGGSGDRQFNSP
jgi:hypothetical protein